MALTLATGTGYTVGTTTAVTGTITNDDSTAVTLKNTTQTIAENTSTATRIKVADIDITDDGLGNNTITLVGADASNFEVEGKVLYLKANTVLNYENKDSYDVKVNIDDSTVSNNPDAFANFTLNITDVNEAPTAVSLNNQVTAIAENTSTATRIKVADIAITDDALGTNNLSVSGTDASFFEVDAIGLYIKANTALNFEAKTSYNVTVNVDDTTIGNTPDAFANFTLNITDVNEAPTVVSAIADQNAKQGNAFSFQIPTNTFTDIDADDVLTYSATLENGNALPTWLTFNSTTRTFSGTPTNDNVGNFNVKAIATDKAGTSANDIFVITVENVNDAPIVANLIADQNAKQGNAFSFQIPTNTFTDIDAGDVLTYSATLENGNALPSWLTFNSTTRTFSGTPTNDNVGNLNVKAIATDKAGTSANDIFAIAVENTPSPITLKIEPQSVTEDGTNNLIYTFTRSGNLINALTVNYSVTGTAIFNTDYNQTGAASFTATGGTVTFATGLSTATVMIDPIADTTVEGDETVELTLALGAGYNIDTTSAVTATITNDDRTLTPITDYAPNVNISTGLIFSTNGGGNLSLDTNRLSASNEVTSVQNGTKSNFNHLFGIYEVVDAEGGINTEKGVLKPGDSDYALYALTTARVKDFIVQAGSSDTPSTATQLGSGVSLQGNKFYAPFVIANCGTYFPNLQQGVEDFVAAENGDVNRFANAPQYVRDLVATEAGNEFNNAPRFVQEPVAYFSFGSANPDKSPHLRSYGNGVYGFEDLPATATQYSNNDFNDAVFALS